MMSWDVDVKIFSVLKIKYLVFRPTHFFLTNLPGISLKALYQRSFSAYCKTKEMLCGVGKMWR